MNKRIYSIDIVRGLIMIIMTLDHSRDFFHYPGHSPLDLQTTTVILFFTRWITHFCAPAFLFLSGISVFLTSQHRNKKELSFFLIKRGLWLILTDIFIITLLFTFDLQYHIFVLEVLWAIGFGMIILALLIWMPLTVIGALAVIIIFGHNILDYIQLPQNGIEGNLITLYLNAVGSVIPLGTNREIVELYAVIPWTGILLAGYVFGHLYDVKYEINKRHKIFQLAGLLLISLFIVLRWINLYGNPNPWTIQRNIPYTVLSFLNVTKQPPSLLFISITLGPVLLLLSLAEKFNNRISSICRVYGNVPYFYFILHLCLLRLINVILIVKEGLPTKLSDTSLVWQAPGFGYPLWCVYLIWVIVVSLLYIPCKWYGQYKQNHKIWWLSYL